MHKFKQKPKLGNITNLRVTIPSVSLLFPVRETPMCRPNLMYHGGFLPTHEHTYITRGDNTHNVLYVCTAGIYIVDSYLGNMICIYTKRK